MSRISRERYASLYGPTTGDRVQHRLRHSLIVVQFANALVLLAGAGFASAQEQAPAAPPSADNSVLTEQTALQQIEEEFVRLGDDGEPRRDSLQLPLEARLAANGDLQRLAHRQV